jgi:hypothetical protein
MARMSPASTGLVRSVLSFPTMPHMFEKSSLQNEKHFPQKLKFTVFAYLPPEQRRGQLRRLSS